MDRIPDDALDLRLRGSGRVLPLFSLEGRELLGSESRFAVTLQADDQVSSDTLAGQTVMVTLRALGRGRTIEAEVVDAWTLMDDPTVITAELLAAPGIRDRSVGATSDPGRDDVAPLEAPDVQALARHVRAVTSEAGKRTAILYRGRSTRADFANGRRHSVRRGNGAAWAMRIVGADHAAYRDPDGRVVYGNAFVAVDPSTEAVSTGHLADLLGDAAGLAGQGPAAGFGTLPEPKAAASTGNKSWYKVHVPALHDDGKAKHQDTYLRLGSADLETENKVTSAIFGTSAPAPAPDGAYLATGDHLTEHVRGRYHQTIESKPASAATSLSAAATANVTKIVDSVSDTGVQIKSFEYQGNPYKILYTAPAWFGSTARETTMSKANADSYTLGTKEDFFIGTQYSGFAGLKSSASVGGSIDVAASLKASMSYALSFTYSRGYELKITNDSSDETVSSSKTIYAGKEFKITVGGAVKNKAALDKEEYSKICNGLTAVAAAASTVWGATAAGLKQGTGGDYTDDAITLPFYGLGTAGATAALTYLMTRVYKEKVSSNFSPTEGNSSITVEKDKIKLQTAKFSINISDSDGIVLENKTKQSKIEMKDSSIEIKNGSDSLSLGGNKIASKSKDILLDGPVTSEDLTAATVKTMTSELGQVVKAQIQSKFAKAISR